MLELIVLFFPARNLGRIAKHKGKKSIHWIIYGILAWFTGEFFGVYLVVRFIGQEYIVFAYFFGIGVAYVFYLLVRQALEARADIEG